MKTLAAFDKSLFYVSVDVHGHASAMGMPGNQVPLSRDWNLGGLACRLSKSMKPNKKYTGKQFYRIVQDNFKHSRKAEALDYVKQVFSLES